MAHWSENSARLKLRTSRVGEIKQLKNLSPGPSMVTVLWLPKILSAYDGNCGASYEEIALLANRLDKSATLCVVATPPDAAALLPFLQKSLKFQMWIAVKTVRAPKGSAKSLPARHVSLLILTRYKSALRHVPTRIKYTFCPACGKTTKDYGGKKHVYHRYGTLMSDVWTDTDCDPGKNIRAVTRRLRDMFGLSPYKHLLLVDLRRCKELVQRRRNSDARKLKSKKVKVVPVTIRSRLINKDCTQALKSLRSDSIDFCFADLPYNLNKRYYRCKDSLEEEEYFAWCNEWLSELHRVLKPGRTLAVLNVPQWAAKHFLFLASIMDFQTWIVWDALGFPSRKIMPAHYAILCFSKGIPRALPGMGSAAGNGSEKNYLRQRAKFYCVRGACVKKRRLLGERDQTNLSDIWSDVHRLTHNSRRVSHPCQLPPLLMRRLFSLFTKRKEVILDCVNGAGTSTLVAEEIERRYIGIELSRRYHNLALKRHRLLKIRENPFISNNGTPTSKNSPVERLPKRKYKVSKKELQLEVKRIADTLGRMPKREDVEKLGTYSIRYFDQYFVSWAEACGAARAATLSRTATTN